MDERRILERFAKLKSGVDKVIKDIDNSQLIYGKKLLNKKKNELSDLSNTKIDRTTDIKRLMMRILIKVEECIFAIENIRKRNKNKKTHCKELTRIHNNARRLLRRYSNIYSSTENK